MAPSGMEEGEKVVRASVSFPRGLLKEFDELAKKLGYRKRSQAICGAIRSFLVEHAWREAAGEVVGVISFVYEHDIGEVAEKLLNVEHFFNDVIVSTMHVHLDEENCLEVIVSRGRAEKIQELASKLNGLRGIKHLKLLTTALVK
ncbi:MAG: nickel-responsive transcriptional regulator NikR [Candidatus Nezhaarchaeota archaeon]|nr:nickel-responsive transcriptional regulator NikR [Candidatus Nezhaarchaeota archaeon]